MICYPTDFYNMNQPIYCVALLCSHLLLLETARFKAFLCFYDDCSIHFFSNVCLTQLRKSIDTERIRRSKDLVII